MRTSFVPLIILALVLAVPSSLIAQGTGTNPFTAMLVLGSSGPQVMTLQKLLNSDPDTRIAIRGVGSPGNETEYFGALTRAAVVRFQQKYASEVLLPVGLTSGNGRVGAYTRAKLNALSVLTPRTTTTNPAIIPPVTVTTPTPVTVSPPASLGPVSAPQNPNLKNLDVFLASIDAVAAKQGLSVTAIATIKEQVMKDVATTTDLRAAFSEQARSVRQSLEDNSFGGSLMARIERVFTKIFMPERALAATGVPFGGALLFSFYCTQSETWLLAVEPLPPSFAALLSYVPFSQAFLSYNIPFTTWLLGEYEPGAGVCVAGFCPYCTTIPNEGMISPMTGSSPA